MFEDVGLYSTENQALYETRSSIMDKVLRNMIREVLNSTIDTLISNYLRKRVLTEDEDEYYSYLDPIQMASKSMLDNVMRQEIK